MDTLAKLFGGPAKVRIMRLFVFNPELILTTKEVATRSKSSPAAVRRELLNLRAAGLVTRRAPRGEKRGFPLDFTFPLLSPLRELLKDTILNKKRELVRRFNQCGKLNLLIVAGVFVENSDGRADLLIVGDNLRRRAIDRVVKGIEGEMGKELSYAVLATDDFGYRLTASDKFVRDVLDYPHQILLDRLGLK